MRLALRSSRLALLAISMCVALNAWSAQTRENCEREFAPRSGQAGKDVIWVPTQEELVMAMLKAAKVTPNDYVVDLGSGDGRIPIAAAKHFGAKALGLEYNPQMVKLAQCNVRAEGLTGKVQIREADIFETDFRDATVITMYLLSDLNMKLRPTILTMKPGTRVVSNSFKMGEWSPDELIEPDNGYTRAYLWVVPAEIEGEWTFKSDGGHSPFELRIEQDFQEIKASVLGSTAGFTVKQATLRGADVQLAIADATGNEQTLKGTVDGDTIRLKGTVAGKPATYVGRRS